MHSKSVVRKAYMETDWTPVSSFGEVKLMAYWSALANQWIVYVQNEE